MINKCHNEVLKLYEKTIIYNEKDSANLWEENLGTRNKDEMNDEMSILNDEIQKQIDIFKDSCPISNETKSYFDKQKTTLKDFREKKRHWHVSNPIINSIQSNLEMIDFEFVKK